MGERVFIAHVNDHDAGSAAHYDWLAARGVRVAEGQARTRFQGWVCDCPGEADGDGAWNANRGALAKLFLPAVALDTGLDERGMGAKQITEEAFDRWAQTAMSLVPSGEAPGAGQSLLAAWRECASCAASRAGRPSDCRHRGR